MCVPLRFSKVLFVSSCVNQVLPCVLPSERDKLHAVKCIQKHRVSTRKARQQVVNGVNMLTQARHPFIVQLTASLQDSRCIYLVMEHLPGGITTPSPLAFVHAQTSVVQVTCSIIWCN